MTLQKKSESNAEMNRIANKMLLNVNGSEKNHFYLQTNNIKTVDEFNLIRQWTKEKGQIILCYKGTYDKDNINAFQDYCLGRNWLVFLFKTESRKRFGAVLYVKIKERDYYHYDSNAFLFSFETSKQFPIQKPERAFKYNSDQYLFHFGEGDLLISKDYLSSSNSKSQFPIHYGDTNAKLNDLTGGESSFRIIELEIFSDNI